MLGLFKYGVATLYNASKNVCIIADRHDLCIPKIFSMLCRSLHGQDRQYNRIKIPLSYLIVYRFTHVILFQSPHKCTDIRGHSFSVRVCRSTLCRWQFSTVSDSERSRIVRLHPHEIPPSKIVELILSLRVVVVTINFRRTGSTSSVLSKSIPDADDEDDDEDAADDDDNSDIMSSSV